MPEDNLCVICKEGATPSKRLNNNKPAMILDLLHSCKERVSLGETVYEQLTTYSSNMTEDELKCVHYHSECRKPIVNKTNIERLRQNKRPCTYPLDDVRSGGPGRTSTSTGTSRPKRLKVSPKEKVCLFSSGDFCSMASSEPLHQVYSDALGKTPLKIKHQTKDDRVRICVADLVDVGDAAALEKHYHKRCLRNAQRTEIDSTDHTNTVLIRSMCDDQLITAIQNTLNGDVYLDMAQVNDTYLSIMRRYDIDVNETTNYCKYLKKLIGERLLEVQFVSSLRRNEPDRLVTTSTVTTAIDERFSMMNDGEIIANLKNVAYHLREEIMNKRGWLFTGTFDDFENPSLLQFFLSHLLFGSHVLKVSGKRDKEVDKTVDVACQFLIQNTHTDRQMKYQPKEDTVLLRNVQTPLTIGLPLAIHSRVRDKNLIQNLSDVYVGSDYQNILDLEKRIEQAVLHRMTDTGGYCLPDFVKKGVNVWFAIDNIDLLEDTPTGQGTFHGTVVVINQQDVDGEPMNGPLILPEKRGTEVPLRFEEPSIQDPVIKLKPLKFESYKLTKPSTHTDFTHTWALANYFAFDEAKVTPARAEQRNGIDNNQCQDGSNRCDGKSSEENSGKGCKPELKKEDVKPTWAATQSLLLSQASKQRGTRTNTSVVAPLFKTSPTDYGTLYTVLRLTQGISATVVGPHKKTVITLDLDLYSRALKLQQSVGNTNWILRAGALHIVFAALHALGKTLDESGIDTCAIETGAYTSAGLRGIFGGKAYKRGLEFHLTISLAILMLRFDAIMSTLPKGPVRIQSVELKNKIHERDPEMVKDFGGIKSWYLENVKPLEEDTDIGEFAQYLNQVESLLQLISSCRSGDWEGYLAALENNIKYFFARDLLNYARLMPVHVAQMKALEKDDPETWDELKSGGFVVAKSEIPFTHLFTDQALEQEIKKLKGHGGMVGLTRSEAALDRLVTITPHLAGLVNQYLDRFPKTSTSSVRTEHYQLSGELATRSRVNALKLRNLIELHNGSNPFTEKTPLKSLASSAIVSDEAKSDILQFAKKGQQRFEEFVSQRLVLTSTHSVWDKVKKLKLKDFSNWTDTARVRVSDKVIKLREERELLGRFLIIQGSRPSLVPKLEETIGDYEMAAVPRSLCAVDGSLHIPTDKASLMHAVFDAKPQDGQMQESSPSQSNPMQDEPAMTPNLENPDKVLIVDAMGILQSMKKTPTMVKFSDLQKAFIKRIENLVDGFDEGRIVFDRYIDQSLKNKTRQKRAITSVEYEIHQQMKLTMSIKELLSSTSTKRKLTCILAEALLEHFTNVSSCRLIVVYDTFIRGHDFQETHTHEEADTLIPLQVLASNASGAIHDIEVWSPDTDVLLLLLDLVSRGRLEAHTSLTFSTGMGTKKRQVDVFEHVQVIGPMKCKGILGLHNFTGADWGGKFVGKSKKTWINAYLKLDNDDPVINCFRDLGEGQIPPQLTDGKLSPRIVALEKFVCGVYCPDGPMTLPQLRWNLFRSKNLEREKLPPTRASLLPHILRANLITMRDKSYVMNCPTLPPLDDNGWTLDDGKLLPVKCLNLPAPKAVIELIKCGCRTGCKGRCSCSNNALPCTPLCKCYGEECDNQTREEVEYDDSDEV